jgi:aspartate/methionine/tyrosine aminotransferase
MKLVPFEMERWQSRFEHRVRLNLSESGVHPLTPGELLDLTGEDLDLRGPRLGYGQSNGSDELRSLIASMYPGADGGSVVVTTGGAEANFAAAWRLMESGPMAALLPNYMQAPGILRSLGVQVFPVPLVESTGWQPDLGALAEALERGARSVLVTHPNNPTGAALDADHRRDLVALARKADAWILSDEVYRGAERAGGETPSLWESYERVLVTGSLSKAYGLPGLRVGWLVGPHEIMEDLWARKDYTTIAPATLSDALARVALRPGNREKVLERTRGIIRTNLPILERWVAARAGDFSFRPPDAGAIGYLAYRMGPDSPVLAEHLRTHQSVLVVPGSHFGMGRYLRIGFGPPAAELEEALEKLGEGYDELIDTKAAGE